MPLPLLRELETLGWRDTFAADSLLGTSARYMPVYCVKEHGKSRRPSYAPLLRNLDALLAAAPDAQGYAARGRVRSILGERDAESDLERALALEPGCAAARAFLAEHRLRGGGESASAAEWLDKAIEREPRDGAYRVWKALGLCLSGELTPALAAARDAAREEPGLVTAALISALISDRLSDPRGAAAAYSAAIERDPRCSGLHSLRAAARWKSGERAGAIEDAHRALDLNPENLEGFAALLDLAAGREPRGASGRRPELLGLADKALLKEPESPWLHAARAAMTDDTEFAKQDLLLTRALELDGGRAWLWAFLGRARLADAAPADRAVALAPDLGWPRAWRAERSRRFGSKEDARRDLDEAIRLGPRYPLAFTWRSRLREEAGDLAGALDDLSACVEELDKDVLFERLRRLEALHPDAEARALLAARAERTPAPAAPAAPPAGAGPWVAVDPRVEFIAALQCLTKGTACPIRETSAYQRRALAALDPEHPAVRLFAAMDPGDFRRLHAVPWILQLGPMPGLAGTGDEEPAPSRDSARRLALLLEALRSLAPGFMEFLERERAFHESLLVAARSACPSLELPPGARFHFLLSPLYHGPGAHTAWAPGEGGSLDVYCVLGHAAIGGDGEARFAFEPRDLEARARRLLLEAAAGRAA